MNEHAHTASADEKIERMIREMTLEEKCLQITSDAPAIERLGWPAHPYWNECLHGVTNLPGAKSVAPTTCFPTSITTASSWDARLMKRIASAIGDEARVRHHQGLIGLTFYSPMINLLRDPRWGRTLEGFTEDPLLNAALAVAYVQGLQGDGPFLKAAACPKHMAVHSGPDVNVKRLRFNSVAGLRDMYESYFPAFEACVRAGAAQFMTCYGALNGVPTTANAWLLKDVLRKEWGFQGLIVSDAGSMEFMFPFHHHAASYREAGVKALKAGCEMEVGRPWCYRYLADAVRAGEVEEALVNAALRHALELRDRLGAFARPDEVPWSRIPASVVNGPRHRRLALQAAREGIVLLRNEGGTLPLPASARRVALIGPQAGNVGVLLGNYFWVEPGSIPTLRQAFAKRARKAAIEFVHEPGCLHHEIEHAVLLPSSALSPLAGDGPGLSGEYAAGNDTAATINRVDRQIAFAWGDKEAPVAGIAAAAPLRVRWSGRLTPSASGRFQFVAYSDGRVRLGADGRTVMDDTPALNEWNRHAPRLVTSPDVELVAGRPVELTLDFEAMGPARIIKLGWLNRSADIFAAAREAARSSDVVVIALGTACEFHGDPQYNRDRAGDLTGFVPPQADDGENRDRLHLGLPEVQERLLREIAAQGKPVVLVLMGGGPISCPWAAEHVPAILEAWSAGGEGAKAIVETIFGDNNPSGKLPVTVYRSEDDLPPFESYSMAGRTYRHFNGTPLWPFGHGLSYTRFAYSGLRVLTPKPRAGRPVRVAVRVRNTGGRAGDEVIQVYVRANQGPAPMPRATLAGWGRIRLKPGEEREVKIAIGPRQMGRYDEASHAWCVDRGSFTVWAGGRSPGPGPGTAPIEESFTI